MKQGPVKTYRTPRTCNAFLHC